MGVQVTGPQHPDQLPRWPEGATTWVGREEGIRWLHAMVFGPDHGPLNLLTAAPVYRMAVLSLPNLSQRAVVQLRCGLSDANPNIASDDQVAAWCNTTPRQVMEIATKAVKLLRHPARSDALRLCEAVGYTGRGASEVGL